MSKQRIPRAKIKTTCDFCGVYFERIIPNRDARAKLRFCSQRCCGLASPKLLEPYRKAAKEELDTKRALLGSPYQGNLTAEEWEKVSVNILGLSDRGSSTYWEMLEGDLCWEWIGAFRNKQPQIRLRGKRWCGSRIIFAFMMDTPLAPEQLLFSECSNRSCVSPKHRHIGTSEEFREDYHGSDCAGVPWATHDRLWSGWVEQPESLCWEWQGGINDGGYGNISYLSKDGTKNLVTSRLAWQSFSGRPIPHGLLVCHKCDNPRCINPKHLFLGTPAENTADMIRKDRQAGRRLHTSEVQEINDLLLSGVPRRQIASTYGITPIRVGNIEKGRSWSIITGRVIQKR